MSNNNDQPPTSGSQVSGYIEAPSTTDTNTPKLDVSAGRSAQISFGELGPLVVNADGTLSRINNWAQMTDSERERTLRVLGKRNQLRVANLKEKGEGEEQMASQP